MDEEKLLEKIPAKYHEMAKAAAAAGLAWPAIFALLVKILPEILQLFSDVEPARAAQPVGCPEAAKTKLAEARTQAAQLLCSICCAERELGCDE